MVIYDFSASHLFNQYNFTKESIDLEQAKIELIFFVHLEYKKTFNKIASLRDKISVNSIKNGSPSETLKFN